MPNVTVTFPQDVESVYQFVIDPEQIKKRSESFGETNVQVDVNESGPTTTVTCTRDVEQDIPSFAKKFFKPRNAVVERKEWRQDGDRRVCQLHIDVRGAPTQIDGEITITPNAGGCSYSVDYQPTAKIPLIRKKIEGFIANLIADEIRREYEYNRAALAEQ